ncbi:hypothetical protein HOK51_10895 [Candidatus Woesearchaeota archaeon]|jgi:hypothetical protein|nr:hypothetical protein [Candidatus Woesearchaeota archaeon]MBT6520328.1 hypothetical protein [Candidatus Woesearchaeota archaeon]MBT7368281.1 hypothetical protein [Candidatus Woesearchaeota archaeon]
MWKKLSELKSHHQIIWAIIIGFAVVNFWRGIWGLMDVYFVPNDLTLSYLLSTFIGVIILIGSGYAIKELM